MDRRLAGVDPAHELGLAVAGSNREAKELDPAFVPDHSDRRESIDYADYSSHLCNL